MTFVMDLFPPFTFVANGVAAGPMSEILRAVCEELKASCKLEVYPWRRALKMAEDGEVDGIYAIARIPEREAQFRLTRPIIESTYGIFVHESSTLKYHAAADLAGYTVGAYGPSAASIVLDGLAQSAPTLNKVVEIDNITLLRKLSVGRYGERGAAIANVDVGRHLIQQEQIAGLKVAGVVGRIDYCIGLSRQKVTPQQAQQFNAALEAVARSGKLKDIATRHGVLPASH
jgi:polar amino acid transport system substrate-binding protein